MQRARQSRCSAGRSAMAQLGGVEREAMIAKLNRQAEEFIAWQSTPARQQVRLPTYSSVSYLLGCAGDFSTRWCSPCRRRRGDASARWCSPQLSSLTNLEDYSSPLAMHKGKRRRPSSPGPNRQAGPKPPNLSNSLV